MTSRPGFLADSNVLIDVAQSDPDWFAWSSEQLGLAADQGALNVNPIVYGELSVLYPDPRSLDYALDALGVERLPLPYEAAFLAARAHLAYRRAGGLRRSALPDF